MFKSVQEQCVFECESDESLRQRTFKCNRSDYDWRIRPKEIINIICIKEAASLRKGDACELYTVYLRSKIATGLPLSIVWQKDNSTFRYESGNVYFI